MGHGPRGDDRLCEVYILARQMALLTTAKDGKGHRLSHRGGAGASTFLALGADADRMGSLCISESLGLTLRVWVRRWVWLGVYPGMERRHGMATARDEATGGRLLQPHEAHVQPCGVARPPPEFNMRLWQSASGMRVLMEAWGGILGLHHSASLQAQETQGSPRS